MYNRKALKREAKQLIRESKPHYMLVTLVFVLLTTGLSYLISGLSNLVGGLGLLSLFLNIVLILFTYVMTIGYSNYALRLSRREETGMKSLFEPFSYTGRSIGVSLLPSIYVFLWTLLAAVILVLLVFIAALFLQNLPGLLFTVIMVLYIAVIVVVFAIALRYAMARFVLADRPETGVGASIRASVQMMQRNKGRLFVLMLSFIGWGMLLVLIMMAVMVIGFFVSGASWVIDSMMSVMEQPDQLELVMDAFSRQMSLWTIVAEVVCLPLTLWLNAYSQTSLAMFYNHVSGYQSRVAAPVSVQAEQPVPAAPIPAPEAPKPAPEQPAPAPAPETPASTPEQPAPTEPAGGYYTPPAAPAEDQPEEL